MEGNNLKGLPSEVHGEGLSEDSKSQPALCKSPIGTSSRTPLGEKVQESRRWRDCSRSVVRNGNSIAPNTKQTGEYHRTSEMSQGQLHDGLASSSLIPGLPDDLGLECLLRLPRSDHRNARQVCRQWSNIIQSDSFYQLRGKRGYREGWLYVLSRDSSDRLRWRALDPCTGKWHDVPKMPGECLRAYGVTCIACHGRLYVIGGAGWFKPSKHDVWCYSPPASKWKQVADLNVPRCYSMGAVLDGKMYVVGGMGNDNSSILSSVETYEIHTDRWSYVASLPMECDLEDAAVLNKELLVRHIRCRHQETDTPYAVRYSADSDCWKPETSRMVETWHGPSVVLDGQLYMLDQIGGIKLMHFSTKSDSWVLFGRLSSSLLTPPCKLVAYSGKLYIIGRGASMVVVDLALNAHFGRNGSGMLLTRRVKGAGCPSDIVVSCALLEV